MQNWIAENWLALFGAVTGTIALLIHYLSYRHTRNKDKIGLAVSWAPHSRREDNIRLLAETESREEYDRPRMVEVFEVTVTNLGNVTAPLSRVGVLTGAGSERLAYISDGKHLHETKAGRVAPIPPKSEVTFSVYLKRGEEPFQVTTVR